MNSSIVDAYHIEYIALSSNEEVIRNVTLTAQGNMFSLRKTLVLLQQDYDFCDALENKTHPSLPIRTTVTIKP